MPLVVDDVVSDAREESDNDETNDVDSGDDGDSISDDDDDDDDDEDDDQGRDLELSLFPMCPSRQIDPPERFANAFAVPVNSLNAHELIAQIDLGRFFCEDFRTSRRDLACILCGLLHSVYDSSLLGRIYGYRVSNPICQ